MGEEIGAPLFEGKAIFSPYYKENPDQTTSSRIDLKLDLNYSRWLRYQQLPWEFDADRSVLMKPLTIGDASGEFAFDLADNWISLADPESTRFPPLQRYLDSVVGVFELECRNADVEDWVSFRRSRQTFAMDKAECYWEFSVADPTGFVSSLEQRLRGYAQRKFMSREISFSGSSSGDGTDSGFGEEREINSCCFRVESKTGQFIRVYAKTNRRVRFEVVHKLVGQGRYQQFGAKTSSNWNIGSFENRLREHSKDALNDLLRWLDQGRPSGIQKTPLELIAAILSISESYLIGSAILALLVNNGAVISKGEFVPSLRRLKSRNVLICAGRRYSIGPAYSDALSQIRVNDFQIE